MDILVFHDPQKQVFLVYFLLKQLMGEGREVLIQKGGGELV